MQHRVRITVTIEASEDSTDLYRRWNKVAETELVASAEMFTPLTTAVALTTSASKLLASVAEAETKTPEPAATDSDPDPRDMSDVLDGTTTAAERQAVTA
jgi:hypothetical protein